MSEHIDPDSGEIHDIPRMPMTQPQMRPLASTDVTEVCTALAKAQGEMEAPTRTKTGNIAGTTRQGNNYSYQYTYAPLEEIIRVVREPFAKHGLSRQQYIVTRGNMWFLRTILWHTSGQWISSDYPIFPEADTGQKFAAAVTYAKRQGLCLVAGIAPEDDFDGGDAETVRVPPKLMESRGTRPARRMQTSEETVPATTAASENGQEKPDTIRQFLERPNYEIQVKHAGGWPNCAEWFERTYLSIIARVNTIDQCAKLQVDNASSLAELRQVSEKEHYKKFAIKVADIEKRISLATREIVP